MTKARRVWKERAAEAAASEQARSADELEQAAVKLRRRGKIVYRASVIGGAADRWIVDRREVTGDELAKL